MSSRRSSPRTLKSPPPSPSSQGGCSNRWTFLNFLALALNVCIFGLTLVLYHRIIGATQSTPCIDENAPPVPAQRTRIELTDKVVAHRERLKLASSQAAEKKSDLGQHQRNPDDSEALLEQRDPPTPKLSEPYLTADVVMPSRDPDRDFHIIFSTGCGPKQNWQAYVLYHSIMESGQIGHVTRIASGCNTKEKADIEHIHTTQIEPMGVRNEGSPSRFHLHLTPEFGYPPGEKRNNARFMYMNKPYGVADWMEKALGYSADKASTLHDDTIIMLLDPDMVILRPIVNEFSKNEIWRTRTSYPRVYSVQHGFPMSQEYGFGMWWHKGVKDIRHVLPADELPSPAQNMTKEQISENYTAGPPYLATARDFYKIVSKWRQIAWPVQRAFPHTILAEMFSYSWAAAHLNLPHQQAHSFMVSAHFEEGFHLFKPSRGNIPSEQMCLGNIPTEYKPHILHYCQRYAIGKYVMGKHRVPQTMVGHANVTKVCQSPLLAQPPTNVSTIYDFYIDPEDGKKYPMLAAKNGMFSRQEHLDRITFMLCEMIGALNRAAAYFKQQHCGDSKANYEKSIIFHQTLQISPQELTDTA